MNLSHIIANRRTVKSDRYTGKTIPNEKVWQVLESANWAPTHGHTEPWRFVVFEGDKKREFVDFMNILDVQKNGANEVRAAKRAARVEKASHIICIGMKRGDNPKIPEIEEQLAVAMAVQNMWLTAFDLGIGAYWSTGSLAFTDELRDFIGLEKGDKSLGFFYMGDPIEGIPKGHRLSGIEEKVNWK